MPAVSRCWKDWRQSGKRPGMYIGSVSRKGLNHLIYEIVDNAVDEHLAGYCSTDPGCVGAVMDPATVTDNGRGIPVDMHEKGMSAERLCVYNPTCRR